MKININEIFLSVDGEVNQWGQGFPTVFIRTQGCNLQCHYCDTKGSWSDKGGGELEVDEIVEKVLLSGFGKVTITGGEPLLQEGVPELCQKLVNREILVSIETNGTQRIPEWPWARQVCWVIDFKLGISGQTSKQFHSLLYPGWGGWIKLVVGNYDEFKEAVWIIEELHSLFKETERGGVFYALSPVHGKVSAEQLLIWMVEVRNEHPVIIKKTSINIQLHKIIFPKGEKNFFLP